MMEITIINPIEQIELICQAMLDLQYFIKNDINDSIKTHNDNSQRIEKTRILKYFSQH